MDSFGAFNANESKQYFYTDVYIMLCEIKCDLEICLYSL